MVIFAVESFSIYISIFPCWLEWGGGYQQAYQLLCPYLIHNFIENDIILLQIEEPLTMPKLLK
jgi:hypothetical protein